MPRPHKGVVMSTIVALSRALDIGNILMVKRAPKSRAKLYKRLVKRVINYRNIWVRPRSQNGFGIWKSGAQSPPGLHEFRVLQWWFNIKTWLPEYIANCMSNHCSFDIWCVWTRSCYLYSYSFYYPPCHDCRRLSLPIRLSVRDGKKMDFGFVFSRYKLNNNTLWHPCITLRCKFVTPYMFSYIPMCWYLSVLFSFNERFIDILNIFAHSTRSPMWNWIWRSSNRQISSCRPSATRADVAHPKRDVVSSIPCVQAAHYSTAGCCLSLFRIRVCMYADVEIVSCSL